MSKGNASKRKGTANERMLMKLLQKLDAEGLWQSRTTLPDGTRRPTPPTHGWDVWSDEHRVFIEAKVRTCKITIKQVREWCRQHVFSTEQTHIVVYRQAGSSEWLVATDIYNCLCMYPLEDYISQVQGIIAKWRVS